MSGSLISMLKEQLSIFYIRPRRFLSKLDVNCLELDTQCDLVSFMASIRVPGRGTLSAHSLLQGNDPARAYIINRTFFPQSLHFIEYRRLYPNDLEFSFFVYVSDSQLPRSFQQTAASVTVRKTTCWGGMLPFC